MPFVLRPNNDNDPDNWSNYTASDTTPVEATGVPNGSYQWGRIAWSSAFNVTADSTAPVLSSPTGAADGTDGYTGSVSTDTGSGTLYFAAIPTAGATPSAAQVKAGTGGDIIDASAGSQAVSTTGVQNVSGSGLSPDTPYKLVFAHEDAAVTPNISTVSVSAEFTTDAEVVDLLGGIGLFDSTDGWSNLNSANVIADGKYQKIAGNGGAALSRNVNAELGAYAGQTIRIANDILAHNAGGSLRVRLAGATTVTTDHQNNTGSFSQDFTCPAASGGVITLTILFSSTAVGAEMDNLIITLVP
jgi:hypothetical protein